MGSGGSNLLWSSSNSVEFGGLRRCIISASIDSKRVVDVKRLLFYALIVFCISDKSVVHLCCSHIMFEAFHHTQSILLYGQAARAISIG